MDRVDRIPGTRSIRRWVWNFVLGSRAGRIRFTAVGTGVVVYAVGGRRSHVCSGAVRDVDVHQENWDAGRAGAFHGGGHGVHRRGVAIAHVESSGIPLLVCAPKDRALGANANMSESVGGFRFFDDVQQGVGVRSGQNAFS